MTDATPVITALAGLCQGFSMAQVPARVDTLCRSLLLDSIGCALAGRQHAAVPKAAAAAQAMCPGDAATGLGSGRRLGVLGAVLDSGAAIRALDFNDFYWGPGIGGHPSDLFAVSLALAEARNASLGELLDATVVGYELYLRLLGLMEPHGAFDHTSAMTLGAAGIAARLLGLRPVATGHALAMALVRGPALSALRHGAISEAKATAPATAAISGVMAAQLAQAGIAGPVAACLGPVGLAGWVRERAHVDALARPDGFGEHMLGVSIKRFPCIGTAQAAVACALSVHQQARAAGSAIASVAVQLTHSPLIVHQTSAAYARPRDRETADHSFFSLLALGLCDGDLQPAQFAARRYEDADVVAMSERLQFSFDLDSADRGLFSARIDAVLQDGSPVSSWTPHPPGHPGNPLDPAGVLAKWHGLAQDCLSTRQADGIAQWCLQGDRNNPVAALMAPLALPGRIPESTPS